VSVACCVLSSLRQDLVQLEKQIFDLEGNYLENTRDFGNIFTGWNHYVSQQHLFVGSSGAQHARVGRGGKVGNEERLFSLSSLSSPASRRDELKRVRCMSVCLHCICLSQNYWPNLIHCFAVLCRVLLCRVDAMSFDASCLQINATKDKDKEGSDSVAGSPAGSVAASGRKRKVTQAAAAEEEEEEDEEEEEED
jgi:hypothetical protein